MILGWFLLAFTLGTEWPQVVGPYQSKEECLNAEEVYQIRGIDTGGCSLIQISLETQEPHD